jgi:hypothetical protein
MGNERSGRTAGMKASRKNYTTEELVRNSLKAMGIDIPEDRCPITDLVLNLLMDPEVDKALKMQASLKLMEFLRPRLKQVDHTGTVNQVQVQLTHQEIQKILQADPFQAAIEVKSEDKK